jgi:hypothetical protein
MLLVQIFSGQRRKVMKDKEREDPKPDHGHGPPEGKGKPVDSGRPVQPHRPSAQISGLFTEMS